MEETYKETEKIVNHKKEVRLAKKKTTITEVA